MRDAQAITVNIDLAAYRSFKVGLHVWHAPGNFIGPPLVELLTGDIQVGNNRLDRIAAA
jgi:hypothetical protein